MFIFLKRSAASVPTMGTDQEAIFFDAADGLPKYKDDTNTVHDLVGPQGPAGTLLDQQYTIVNSSGGVVTIDLDDPYTYYLLTLTENVTSWSFLNVPSTIGPFKEIAVEIVQDGTTPYSCASPATLGTTAGGAWTVTSILDGREVLGMKIHHSSFVKLFPSGVFG